MKYVLDRKKTNTKIQYDGLNDINKIDYELNYFKTINDLNSIQNLQIFPFQIR